MDPLKMYFLLKMGIFHCYVSLQEGSSQMLRAIRVVQLVEHDRLPVFDYIASI